MLANTPALAGEEQARAVLSYREVLAFGAMLARMRADEVVDAENKAFLRGVAEGVLLSMELAAGAVKADEFWRKVITVSREVRRHA